MQDVNGTRRVPLKLFFGEEKKIKKCGMGERPVLFER